MRLITKTPGLALVIAATAALSARDAAAQLANLIPSRVGGTFATRATSGTLIVANRGIDNSVGFGVRSDFSGAGWSKWDAWTQLGGATSAAPVTLVKSDGRVIVLVRGPDNALYTNEETFADTGLFQNGWVRMPTATSTGGTLPALTARPAMVRRTDGTLAVYAMDGSGTAWVSTQAGTGWSSWISMGRPTGVTLRNSPVLALMNNGAYLLLAAATNNRLYARMQSAGTWGPWTDLGGAVAANDAIAAGPNSNGRVSVFVNNTSSTISVITQTAVNANTWTAWSTLSGTQTGQSRPAVAVQLDGRLAVFFHSATGSNLYWRVQTAASATTWTNWTNIMSGAATSAPAAFTDKNGVIHLLLMGPNGYYSERIQVAANSTSWNQWQAGHLGGPFLGP